MFSTLYLGKGFANKVRENPGRRGRGENIHEKKDFCSGDGYLGNKKFAENLA